MVFMIPLFISFLIFLYIKKILKIKVYFKDNIESSYISKISGDQYICFLMHNTLVKRQQKILLRALKSKQKQINFGGESKVGDMTIRLSFSLVLFPHGFALRAEPNCEAKQYQ